MAKSDNDGEFAFNLFTDIAPLLALLGDQFARQFTSESLTWVDHLISAMVPLGILGYVTGAIRVQGPRLAKSSIGRGRENRALAEIELMSSTSNEVCELFNGKSIIRVMGKPMIAQILMYPIEYEALKKKYEEEDQERLKLSTSNDRVGSIISSEKHKSTTDRSCGIHTFETALSLSDSRARLLRVEEYQSQSHQIIRRFLSRLTRRYSFEDGLQSKNIVRSLGPPNLQLGLSSDQFQKGFPRKGHEIFLAAVVAVLLQASLIAIATLTVYHESTKRAVSFDAEKYGYSCYITGSIILSIGVGVCSFAVERNTVEYDWKVLARIKSGGESAPGAISISTENTDVADAPRLLWLQRTQVVNDQAFGGFAILAGPKHHIITSSRIEDTTSLLDPTYCSKSAGVKAYNEQPVSFFHSHFP
ncbi:hypothetical protein IQ07DRAFT_501735 [Pyrenochaeta sp. DS3sAY3a]|nr:hypothetical protein IQ07DRAFT_501735 [Pyrenochaeta sp. DS3sAY3a]